MDMGRPIAMNESQAIITIFQYYRGMCPRRSHESAPLREDSSVTKGIEILRNGDLEVTFQELKRMISAEIILNYPDWEISLTLHTDASDKQLDAVIS